MSVLKKLLPLAGTLLLSLILVAYYPSWRDSVSWHIQHELCQAAAAGRLNEVRFLGYLGADLGGWNTSYEPIHFAAASGQTQVVAYLLDKGESVNCLRIFHYTPLMQASGHGHSETVKLLLFRSASVNEIGDDGTALDLAILKGNSEVIKLLRAAGAKTLVEIRSTPVYYQ